MGTENNRSARLNLQHQWGGSERGGDEKGNCWRESHKNSEELSYRGERCKRQSA